jgi:hypothetical protein
MKLKVAILFVLLCSALSAVPYTCLGGMKVPSAYIVPDKTIEFGLTNYMAPPNDVDSPEYDFAVNINGGLFNWASVGFVYTGNSITVMNFKARIIEQTETLPAIAIGLDNFMSDQKEDGPKEYDVPDSDDYDANSFYFVMSKRSTLRGLPFVPFLQTDVHIGFGNGRFKGNTELSQQLSGVFFGMEFRPSNLYSVIAEMDGYNLNLGLHVHYKNYDFRLGAYRFEENYKRDPKIAFNILYKFDKFTSSKDKKKYNRVDRKTIKAPGTTTVIQSNTNNQQQQENPLLQELREVRKQREETAKELDEIKKFLEDED